MWNGFAGTPKRNHLRDPAERLSWGDAGSATSTSAFAKGQRYLRQNRVIEPTVNADGTRVTARVRGSEPQPYEQSMLPISLKAGGLGLNLTAADTVIHHDPWWNPAEEDQATDRVHRIGQDKPIFLTS